MAVFWIDPAGARQTATEGPRGDLGVKPGKHVFGPELDDDRVGAFGHGPVQPGEAAGDSISRHARIDDLDRVALGLERLFEPRRKGGARRQTETGGERIPQPPDLEPGTGRRSFRETAESRRPKKSPGPRHPSPQ